MRRVAVVGSGIAGLGAAEALAAHASVSLFEAEPRLGGHAHTVPVRLDGIEHGVDVGFLVFNERTYPQLIALFERLGVETAVSEMSFSVQSPITGWEWCGSDLNGVFAQRRNLVSPHFIGMLAEIVRFNRVATALAERDDEAALDEPIGDFLDRLRFGTSFREGYLLPMIGCIWSCPMAQMLRFPIATLIRFCHNHGLLQIADRPRWYTVRGGSSNYVDRIGARLPDVRRSTPVLGIRRRPPGDGAAGVMVRTARGTERFDEVVLAGHPDDSLALLDDARVDERSLLTTIRYQQNRVVLHTDATHLPKRRRAWAAWNYERAADPTREQAQVCLHYLINRLQPLPWATPVIVSLNPIRPIAPERVIGEWPVDHPVFDRAAIAAQSSLPSIQGRTHVWFAGAWTGYGFHEDGLKSGLRVADAMRARWAAQTSANAA